MRSEVGVPRRLLLANGTAALEAARIGAPRREALRLWAELSGETPGAAVIEPDQTVPADCAAAFAAAIRRRAAGEPFAHVSGWAGFRHLTLRSDRRALIPRPETEGLVELVLARVPAGRVADVGTGGGCIALSLAAEGRYDEVVGIDVSGGREPAAHRRPRGAGPREPLRSAPPRKPRRARLESPLSYGR
jgi:release factor glutamine methyltransferase